MLQKFGFTQYESQVFEVLTASDEPLDASSIVKYSHVPKSKVYEVLNRLVEKGLLLTSFHERKKLYNALPLETTIKKLTHEFEENVKELKHRKYTLTPNDDRVWTLQGRPAIASLVKDLIEQAEHSIYLSGWSDDIQPMLSELESHNKQGIKVEVLSVGEVQTLLGDIHVLLPDEKHEALERHKLIIIDEKEMLFAGVENQTWHGIKTMSNPLVKFFTEFFYHDIALTEITKKYQTTLMQDEEIKNILMKLRY
ncbi:helix-turn-helix domain-containing protein [Halobacillus shinanisalinarum]|uniref:Helix-turn-helix domain-containing protein n=1 Tax=Halobacillus shinanisalinarum TaxID=2932258 RepID=A0ABY4H2A3_9BACI|nr:TrmB family transcriptional regulator [Halobacillus shinanisalinarum]UOQ94293.1 helix-turn-helix domain-containing protein [Halobacillus shinanisalinarum]